MIVTFGSLAVVAQPSEGAIIGTFGFTDVVSGDGNPDLTGQVFVDVFDDGTTAGFRFRNTGPVAGVITQIYIEDGNSDLSNGVLDASRTTPVEVVFDPPDSPGGTFPEGNTIGFTEDWEIVADNPATKNGVDLGEMLGVTFTATPSTVLSAIESGDIRFGLHIQSLTGGGSESYVNTPTNVPEPNFLSLLACASGVAASRRRRRRQPIAQRCYDVPV